MSDATSNLFDCVHNYYFDMWMMIESLCTIHEHESDCATTDFPGVVYDIDRYGMTNRSCIFWLAANNNTGQSPPQAKNFRYICRGYL